MGNTSPKYARLRSPSRSATMVPAGSSTTADTAPDLSANILSPGLVPIVILVKSLADNTAALGETAS